MEKSKPNTDSSVQLSVCILTAGLGTRMGPIHESINKALLPIDGVSIISKIINCFPQNTHFIIGLGHLGIQVKSFLTNVFPEKTISFVNVDKYNGNQSGPGYSLLKCEPLLQQPFFFIPCDALVTEIEYNATDHNWIGISEINSEISAQYCTVKLNSNKILSLIDKEPVMTEPVFAYTGVSFIKDHATFFKALREDKDRPDGEHQISSGLNGLISTEDLFAKKIRWEDIGTDYKYEKVLSTRTNFNFSKTDEFIYFENNQVIKFFSDESICQNRAKKSKLNKLFPKTTLITNNFYAYSFCQGQTLYEHSNIEIIQKLFKRLRHEFWEVKSVDIKYFKSLCHEFYFSKTTKRLNLFNKKYPRITSPLRVNGHDVYPIEYILERIPWESLTNGIPSLIHGDLQFDNILYDAFSDQFTLIDWRQDFAGAIEYGDLHYDFAKLFGGLILDYRKIKANEFDFKQNSFDYYIEIPSHEKLEIFQEIIETNAVELGLDFRRIQLITGLIFLNMAPLHSRPFDKLLFALAHLFLTELIDGNK